MTDCNPPQKQDFGPHLGQCKYFTVDLHNGDFARMPTPRSFVSLLVVDGAGTVTAGGETLDVKKGDSLFIPGRDRGHRRCGQPDHAGHPRITFADRACPPPPRAGQRPFFVRARRPAPRKEARPCAKSRS